MLYFCRINNNPLTFIYETHGTKITQNILRSFYLNNYLTYYDNVYNVDE